MYFIYNFRVLFFNKTASIICAIVHFQHEIVLIFVCYFVALDYNFLIILLITRLLFNKKHLFFCTSAEAECLRCRLCVLIFKRHSYIAAPLTIKPLRSRSFMQGKYPMCSQRFISADCCCFRRGIAPISRFKSDSSVG